MENKRGTWGSNFGFLMAAIGSAVGLGNIWGFPFKMGANGGFAFLVIYLILAAIVGVTVMLGELTIGRKTGLSTIAAYRQLNKKHAWIGYLGLVCGFIIMAFYSVLGGVILRYTAGYLLQLLGVDGFAGAGAGFFGAMLYEPGGMIFFHALFMLLNILVVMGGVRGGIEKFSVFAMPALTVLLVIIIVYIAVQPGALAGYAFMFKPNFAPLREDFFKVLRTAAGQMFFSLSLGLGCMINYGSYLEKKENLQRNALIIPIADTIVALLAGIAVMPACAAFGVDFGAGPGLLFVSVQQVFLSMGSVGNLIGFLFYFLVLIAAISSSISMLEIVTSHFIDRRILKGKEPGRKKITCIAAGVIFVIGLPVALDALGGGGAAIKAPYELLGYTGDAIKGWCDCWLDVYDLIAEGFFMPIGALLMSLLIGWSYGTEMIRDECELCGEKFRLFGWFKVAFRIIVPIGMVVVLIGQLMSFFG